MAKSVKALAPIKSRSTPISHDCCSTVGEDVSLYSTHSIMFRVVRTSGRCNYLFSCYITERYVSIVITSAYLKRIARRVDLYVLSLTV